MVKIAIKNTPRKALQGLVSKKSETEETSQYFKLHKLLNFLLKNYGN